MFQWSSNRSYPEVVALLLIVWRCCDEQLPGCVEQGLPDWDGFPAQSGNPGVEVGVSVTRPRLGGGGELVFGVHSSTTLREDREFWRYTGLPQRYFRFLNSYVN